MKILYAIIILVLIFTYTYAAEFTTNYNLEIPSIATRDWQSTFSKDMVTIDAVLNMVSADTNLNTDTWLNVNMFGTTFPANVHAAIDYAATHDMRNLYVPGGPAESFSDTLVIDDTVVIWFGRKSWTYTGVGDAIQVTTGAASIQGHLQLLNDTAHGDGAVGIRFTASKSTRHEWYQINGFDIGIYLQSLTATGMSSSNYTGIITNSLIGMQLEVNALGWITMMSFNGMRIGGSSPVEANSYGVKEVWVSGGSLTGNAWFHCSFELFETGLYLNNSGGDYFYAPYMESNTTNVVLGPNCFQADFYTPTLVSNTTLLGEQQTPDTVVTVMDSRYPKDFIWWDRGTYKGEEQGFNNILPNGGFESWRKGTSDVAPDGGWILNWSGGLGWPSGYPARYSDIRKSGSYCAKVSGETTSTRLYLQYAVPNYKDYLSEDMVFSCWVSSDVASGVVVALGDNVSTTWGQGHSGGNTWENLYVKHTVSPIATYIKAYIAIYNTQTSSIPAFVDGAVLVAGENFPRFDNKVITDTGNQILYGKMGINVSPDNLLCVEGTITADSVSLDNGLTVASSRLYVGAPNIGINTTAPLVSLDVAGMVSADAYKFDGATKSFDVATHPGPGLYVSKDVSGNFGHLIFYNGLYFKKVTLE